MGQADERTQKWRSERARRKRIKRNATTMFPGQEIGWLGGQLFNLKSRTLVPGFERFKFETASGEWGLAAAFSSRTGTSRTDNQARSTVIPRSTWPSLYY